jgi:uncharacterized damage-inducible protein DinB
MRADDVRFLYAYDRWATERVLDAWERADGTSPAVARVIGERGLAAIMVHTLGATERWRAFFASEPHPGRRENATGEPSPAALRRDWETEWERRAAWLDRLDDEAVAAPAYDPDDDPTDSVNGIPVWQLMVHVVNHGTQHRSEAASILTDAGASPGDLDLGDYAWERHRNTAR